MEINYALIGKRIRETRKQRGLSAEELAEIADLSTVYISYIENAKRKPSLESLIKISNALEITIDELLYGNLLYNGTVTTARTPSYPEEWKNQFGIPVEEHQKSMQVNIFEGYAVFDIQEKKKVTDKSTEKAKKTSTAESEEKSYEQQTLFPSTNMY